MHRLLGIWHGSVTPATGFEQALDAVHDFWVGYLTDIDIDDGHDWILHGGRTTLARATAAIDVELAQLFGHRSGVDLLIDDELGGITTAGDLVARIAMLAVLLDKVRPDIAERSIVPRFLHLGRRYEASVTGLATGSRSRTGPTAHTRQQGAQTHHTIDTNSRREHR